MEYQETNHDFSTVVPVHHDDWKKIEEFAAECNLSLADAVSEIIRLAYEQLISEEPNR